MKIYHVKRIIEYYFPPRLKSILLFSKVIILKEKSSLWLWIKFKKKNTFKLKNRVHNEGYFPGHEILEAWCGVSPGFVNNYSHYPVCLAVIWMKLQERRFIGEYFFSVWVGHKDCIPLSIVNAEWVKTIYCSTFPECFVALMYETL